DRYELYDKIVDSVLANRYTEDRTRIDLVRSRLEAIAFGMHTGEGLGEDRASPILEATFDEIDKMIRGEDPGTEIEVREDLLSNSGLFRTVGKKIAGFSHLSFQEFNAARRMNTIANHNEDLFQAFLKRSDQSEWRSTLGFLFGDMLAAHSDKKKSREFLQRLIHAVDPANLGLAIVI